MQRRRFVTVALVSALALSAMAVVPPARRRTARPSTAIQHIVVVVLENEDLSRAQLQPYMTELAARGALLNNYHAIAHPSQPNYIAMMAGSNYVTTNDPVVLDVEHLGNLI